MNKEMDIERQPSKTMGVFGEAVESLVTDSPFMCLGLAH
jgi:hypothetical protein